MKITVYAIVFFGALMVLLSVVMAISPDRFSSGIRKFSRLRYFHELEIVSRLFFGVIFVAFAKQTLFPWVIGLFGYLMIGVGLGLLVMGRARHQQFATWSAARFNTVFRPASMASIAFGMFIVYGALAGG